MPQAQTSEEEMKNIFNIFEMMMYFPLEYLPRQLNLELCKRGQLVDLKLRDLESVSLVQGGSTILRSFACRILSHLDTVDRSVQCYVPSANGYSSSFSSWRQCISSWSTS